MSGRRVGAHALVTLLFVLAGSRSLAAQPVKSAMERVAQAWQRGDVDAIADMIASTGISIDVTGTKVGPLQDPRRSAAGLKFAFLDRESVSAKVTSVREVAGDSNRAYGSINWETRIRGTTTPASATIFIGLLREENGWRVYEIRLLPR